MEHITKNLGTYNLHLIKTDRFKTTNIRLCFRNQIKKEPIL